MLALGAVAEIAMDCDDGLRHVHQLVRCDETQHIRQARVSLCVAMTAAHAAADGEIVAGELVVFENRDEAEVVGKDVNVIHRRNDKRGLELARQISFAVKRVLEILVRRVVEVQLRAINPNRMIRLGARLKRVGHAFAIFKNLRARLGVGGCWRRHDVAVHVAAGRKCRKHRLVDLLHERAEAGLHNAVKLYALARRDAERVVAVL